MHRGARYDAGRRTATELPPFLPAEEMVVTAVAVGWVRRGDPGPGARHPARRQSPATSCGTIDIVIQRAIALLQASPRIPLWLTLSAALPRDWGTVEVYFGITIILSVLGWTGLARTVRGKFLALREEDFTQAAKYLGASEMRIIIRHMVRSFSSHLIAVLTLRVPEMILAETSLSFLGLGLREPVISWGVLLTGVQNIPAVALAPWLFLPGVAIVVTVLAFNFVGDGLRDSADPLLPVVRERRRRVDRRLPAEG